MLDTTEVTLHAYMQKLFACGISAVVRVECEGDTAAWLAGTLVVPSVQGHRLLPWQDLWLCLSLFWSLL